MKTILSALVLSAALVAPAFGDDNSNSLDYSVLSQAPARVFSEATPYGRGRPTLDHENRVRNESWSLIESGAERSRSELVAPVEAPEAWTGRAG